MRILLIEDEEKIAHALKKGLEQEGFAADTAHSAKEGFGALATTNYDLLILDRMLPDLEGAKLLQAIRQKGLELPVIFLTAKDKVSDRVAGLNAGADDYLVKPFAFEELLARVRALLRRPRRALDTILTFDDLRLDVTNFTVTRQGKPISLTAKEFSLLEYLMRHPGRVLSKETIISHVWNYDADILPNTVEVYMRYLRQKIEKPFKGKPLIKTRHGFGYVFGETT